MTTTKKTRSKHKNKAIYRQIKLTFHVGDGANVVFRGQHKLVVHHPVGSVAQTGRRVQLDDLVILDRYVVLRLLQVGNLQGKERERSLIATYLYILSNKKRGWPKGPARSVACGICY